MAHKFINGLSGISGYSCFLIHVNFENNNNINNFCIIKLLENSAKTAYFLYSREGRIGLKGKENLDCYVMLPIAIDAFCSLIKLKTGLSYEEAKSGNSLKNHYIYQEDNEPEDTIITISDEVVRLFELIYPKIEKCDEIVIPKKNIIRARQLLQLINDCIDDKEKHMLSMEWHSLVPMYHEVAPKIILNVEEKMELLDDIEARKIISKSHLHGLQYKYDILNADIYPASPEECSIISMYYTNTTPKPRKIVSIYCVNRHADIGMGIGINTCTDNGMGIGIKKTISPDALLFHGSRNINYHGIIKKGLLIKPYGVHLAGALFGNGIYFTNSSEKCMHYAEKSSKSHSIITLCAVQLGTPKTVLFPPGHTEMDRIITEEKPDSVFVPGRYSQSGSTTVELSGIPVNIANTTLLRPEAYMAHDEFVVYNEANVTLKYLIILL